MKPLYFALLITLVFFSTQTFTQSLRLQTLSTLIVRSVEDADGSFFFTQNDRTDKEWSMRVFALAGGFDTVVTNQSRLSVQNLASGMYVVAQADSIGWHHLGILRDSVAEKSSRSTDTITIEDGESREIIWVNTKRFVPDTVRFRTFLPTPTEMGTAKPAKLKPKKGVYPIPNIANVVFHAFDRFANKDRPLIIGRVRLDSIKFYSWVQLTKAASFAKLFIKEHTGPPLPFDSLIRKPPLRDPRRTNLNNVLFAHLVAVKLNIIASDSGIVRDPFTMGFPLGDLLYREPNSQYKGMRLRKIVDFADSMMTYRKRFPLSAYEEIYNILRYANYAFHDSNKLTLNDTFPGISSFGTDKGKKYVRIKTTVRLRDVNPRYFDMDVDNLPMFRQESQTQRTTFISEKTSHYPNPFNPITTIRFVIRGSGLVSLKVYDVLGREVATLLNNETMEEGEHNAEFDANGLPSGVYFYRLIATNSEKNFVEMQKMILMK
ncbi:MAG: T9SS type A sorting domain-containing protein [Ignavibacteriales bacterium]|nr:T9SS type A sorting domain-containing protein [Ignavibacteriales bacterium]